MIILSLSAARCSVPDLSTSLARSDDETTASIAGAMLGVPGNISPTDLAAARAAALSALESTQTKPSASWDNPLTGAHGTVTPVAAIYLDSYRECRDFLSTYRRETTEAWLQGEACRNQTGAWEIGSIRAWQRP